MKQDSEYSFARYLSAKKTVDDRALNQNVWTSLQRLLSRMNLETRLKVLEIGAGVGTMLERSLDWGLLKTCEYTALDTIKENMKEAYRRVPSWAANQGYAVENDGAAQFRVHRGDQDVIVRLEACDIFEFIDRGRGEKKFDLLIANAFLDLVDVGTALPKLFELLNVEGLFYFTVTFDGATILQPEIDPDLDAQIESLYHQTMDRRIIDGKPSGDSQTGRHFFEHVRRAGGELVSAGSSDWVVFAGPRGYPADEDFFLHFIVSTIASALEGHPDLDPRRLSEWVMERRRQVDNGSLVYVAHQLDFLGRVFSHNTT